MDCWLLPFFYGQLPLPISKMIVFIWLSTVEMVSYSSQIYLFNFIFLMSIGLFYLFSEELQGLTAIIAGWGVMAFFILLLDV